MSNIRDHPYFNISKYITNQDFCEINHVYSEDVPTKQPFWKVKNHDDVTLLHLTELQWYGQWLSARSKRSASDGWSKGGKFFNPPNHSSPKSLMICGWKNSSLKKNLQFILHTVLISCHVFWPSLELTVRTWTWMIGILVRCLLGFGLFSAANC